MDLFWTRLGCRGVASSLGGLEEKQLSMREVDVRLMWTGAALVLFGTIGYTGQMPINVETVATIDLE